MREEREITLRELFTDIASDLYSAGKEALPYAGLAFCIVAPVSLTHAFIAASITQGYVMLEEINSGCVERACKKTIEQICGKIIDHFKI